MPVVAKVIFKVEDPINLQTLHQQQNDQELIGILIPTRHHEIDQEPKSSCHQLGWITESISLFQQLFCYTNVVLGGSKVAVTPHIKLQIRKLWVVNGPVI